MKFECGDLERALANPDLMADAKEHLRDCAGCRNEYRIWREISSTAKELRCEWESPNLWPNIRRAIEAESRARKCWWMDWRPWAMAAVAAMMVPLAIEWRPQPATLPAIDNNLRVATVSGRDFLSEQALEQVEKNEAAYRRSIDELSRLAQAKLESRASSPILASYREKLLMLDSAILEIRSNIAQNRFNVSLQMGLADLYREKQNTLQEVLSGGQRN